MGRFDPFLRLHEIQAAYLKHGWKIHTYQYAAWDQETMDILKMEVTDSGDEFWGASIGKSMKQGKHGVHSVMVRAVDFSLLLSEVLARSSLNATILLMKMDIEGAEYAVLKSMMDNGILCRDMIRHVTIELHGALREGEGPREGEIDESYLQRFQNQTLCRFRGGPTTFEEFDDESYLHDGISLP